MPLFWCLHCYHLWEINLKSFYFSLKNTKLSVGEVPTVDADVSSELRVNFANESYPQIYLVCIDRELCQPKYF